MATSTLPLRVNLIEVGSEPWSIKVRCKLQDNTFWLVTTKAMAMEMLLSLGDDIQVTAEVRYGDTPDIVGGLLLAWSTLDNETPPIVALREIFMGDLEVKT